jgi:hypothetical protein
MRKWMPGDLALFNLVGWYNPKIDKLPVVILITETVIGGSNGWYCVYVKDLGRKRFILNSELIKV